MRKTLASPLFVKPAGDSAMPRLTLRTLLAYIDDTSSRSSLARSKSARPGSEAIDRTNQESHPRGVHVPIPTVPTTMFQTPIPSRNT